MDRVRRQRGLEGVRDGLLPLLASQAHERHRAPGSAQSMDDREARLPEKASREQLRLVVAALPQPPPMKRHGNRRLEVRDLGIVGETPSHGRAQLEGGPLVAQVFEGPDRRDGRVAIGVERDDGAAGALLAAAGRAFGAASGERRAAGEAEWPVDRACFLMEAVPAKAPAAFFLNIPQAMGAAFRPKPSAEKLSEKRQVHTFITVDPPKKFPERGQVLTWDRLPAYRRGVSNQDLPPSSRRSSRRSRRATARAPIVTFDTETKHLTDAIKMAAYRAETALVGMLNDEAYARTEDEERAFVREVLLAPADVLPDAEKGELRVRIHGLANPRSNATLRHLCAALNETEITYPGTWLRLRCGCVTRPWMMHRIWAGVRSPEVMEQVWFRPRREGNAGAMRAARRASGGSLMTHDTTASGACATAPGQSSPRGSSHYLASPGKIPETWVMHPLECGIVIVPRKVFLLL